MSSGQERVLRRRIRSIESTEKLTRAMDLISASQIVRAQNRIVASRPYAEGIGEILGITTADLGPASPLGGVPGDPRHVLVVAVVADRGLCGAYNSNVLRTADRVMRAGEGEGRAYSLVTVGRRAQRYFRFHGQGDRDGVREDDRTADLRGRLSGRPGGDGPVSRRQRRSRPARLDALPLRRDSGRRGARSSSRSRRRGAVETKTPTRSPVRPRASTTSSRRPRTCSLLVPSFAEAAIFDVLLEASASEHTARQRRWRRRPRTPRSSRRRSPDDEPRPPRFDYDRDYGDRRWRRGDAAGRSRRPVPR